MAEISSKLIELRGAELTTLHDRLHKSDPNPATLELHHLVLNVMARRGAERPQDDWDNFEIQVDYLTDVDLTSLGSSLPEGMADDVLKRTGSSLGNVRVVLTIDGYELRIDPIAEEPVNKMIREENGKWVVYDKTGTRKFGTYETEQDAKDRLDQIHRFSKADNTPPKAVRDAARRALEWISDGKAGGGFTSVGRRRAQQLASGEAISLDTLKRMKSFFSLHEVDKNAVGFSQGEKGFPSPGRVAWDAWGGDAGFAWAESMVARAEREEVEKHNPGGHEQKTHGSWAKDIAEDILAGKQPEVEPENISALFMGMRTRTDHPDITELRVKGSLLFGGEGLGIARKDMPQIPAEARPQFLADLAKEGISVTKERVDPTKLKPVQKEISGSRVGAIYQKTRIMGYDGEERGKIPENERILVSKDGYVIDGHHTWGAAVAHFFDGSEKLPIYRIDLTAKEALDASLEWSKAKGYEGQGIDAKEPAKKSLFIWKHLAGQHDQSSHGNWAGEASREDILASGKIPDWNRDEKGRIINPDATGGYKADIPEKIEFAGTTLTPEHSLWHHMVPDGRGGYEPTQERALLHQQIIANTTSNIPVSGKPTFTMLGGGPASGKSSVLNSGLIDAPKRTDAVFINADDIKELLPENERMRFRGNNADFFRASEFVHEESSILAKRIQKRAIENGQDVVLDGTGDSAVGKLASKVEQARQAGYKVNGLYVTIPTEEAVIRSNKRALGETARYVPENVVRTTHQDVSRTLPLAIEAGLFDKVSLWDNTERGNLKKIGEGEGSNFVIYDAQGWADFLAKKG